MKYSIVRRYSMEFKTVSRSVESVMKDVQKGKISLNLDIQRPTGAYNNFGKSMIIDSLLRGYPIGIIYITVKEDENGKKVKYLADGNQRIGNLKEFIIKQDGVKNFKLSGALGKITIDGKKYEIGGKKYDALDDEVKSALDDASLTICEISDYTREELNDFYTRINSGIALNAVQKLLPIMSVDLLNDIQELTDNPFFEKVLTKRQLITSTDVSTILEVLMLMEFSPECPFDSLRNTDKIKYITNANENINEENIIAIAEALDKLNEHYTKRVKVTKTLLSLMIFGVCKVQKEQRDLAKYFEWLDNFLATYKEDEEFMQFCKQGTANSANVHGRLERFNKAIQEM